MTNSLDTGLIFHTVLDPEVRRMFPGTSWQCADRFHSAFAPRKTLKPPVPPAIENEPSATPGEAECVVCMDRAVATNNIGCSHSCLCVTCARKLADEKELRCPVCRAVLERIEIK